MRRLFAFGAYLLVTAIATSAMAVPKSSAIHGDDSLTLEKVRSSHAGMVRWLKPSRHRAGWENYLQCAKLNNQLQRGNQADAAAVRSILARYSSRAAGLKDRRFVAVRLAMKTWLAELSASTDVSPAQDRPVAKESQQLRNQEIRGIRWRTDYFAAHKAAKKTQKLLFIFFYKPGSKAAKAFETVVLPNVATGARRYRYEWLRLPLDYRLNVGDKQARLLKHPAFANMHGRQGVAILDFENPQTHYYGDVVSEFPFNPGKYYRRQAMAAILDLPPGTLTQRTMIYAVRTHWESPRSAIGLPNHLLLQETQLHSRHQARISEQGHHNWETRFHRINVKLGGSQLAREVVAESWPGKTLVEAAVECVNSWRQSPGHWSAVRGRHAEFGFDIKRGSNGIWYATGIFGG